MAFLWNSEEAKGYQPPRLTDKQIAGIEYLIAISKDATNFGKRVAIWLIRQTDNLTKQVALSVPEVFLGKPAIQIQDAIHNMCSYYGTTHIGSVFDVAGTEMLIHHHGKRFVEQTFIDSTSGRTIWCAYEWYSRNAELLTPPTQEELDNIDLKKILNPWERG